MSAVPPTVAELQLPVAAEPIGRLLVLLPRTPEELTAIAQARRVLLADAQGRGFTHLAVELPGGP